MYNKIERERVKERVHKKNSEKMRYWKHGIAVVAGMLIGYVYPIGLLIVLTLYNTAMIHIKRVRGLTDHNRTASDFGLEISDDGGSESIVDSTRDSSSLVL